MREIWQYLQSTTNTGTGSITYGFHQQYDTNKSDTKELDRRVKRIRETDGLITNRDQRHWRSERDTGTDVTGDLRHNTDYRAK